MFFLILKFETFLEGVSFWSLYFSTSTFFHLGLLFLSLFVFFCGIVGVFLFYLLIAMFPVGRVAVYATDCFFP